MNTAKLSGFVAGLGITFTWATWIVATRLGLQTDMTVFDLFGVRLLVASVLVAPFLLYMKSWKGLSVKQYAILSISGGMPHCLLAYSALERTSTAQFSVFSYGMAPIVTAIAGFIFFKSKLKPTLLAGTFFIGLGIIALGYKDFTNGIDSAAWLGNLMAVIAITSFAFYMIYADTWQITVAQSIMACTVLNGLFYVPVWLLMSPMSWAEIKVSEYIVQGLFQGIIPGIFALFVTTVATRKIGANVTSLFFALIPITASFFALFSLDESMTIEIIIGLLLTTIGIGICSVEIRTITSVKQRGVRLGEQVKTGIGLLYKTTLRL